MKYLIFSKNLDNMGGTLCRVVPTQTIANNINYNNDYKVIEVADDVADDIITGQKVNVKYSGNTYSTENSDSTHSFTNEDDLTRYIQNTINYYNDLIKTDGVDYSEWDSYITQLENFDTSSLTYPFQKTLEKHFKDNSLIYLHPLQLY